MDPSGHVGENGYYNPTHVPSSPESCQHGTPVNFTMDEAVDALGEAFKKDGSAVVGASIGIIGLAVVTVPAGVSMLVAIGSSIMGG